MTKKKKPHIASGEVSQLLSDNHKRDILKKLYQRNFEVENQPTKSTSTKRSQPAPTEKKDSVLTDKLVPSINPDAPTAIEGQREATVKKRKCTDILNEDIDKLLGMDGYVTSAIVADDYVDLLFDSILSIRFYNAFRDASPAAYNLIKQLAHTLNTSRQPILVCFIGIVTKTKNGFQVQIMDPTLITFNNQSIFRFSISEQEDN